MNLEKRVDILEKQMETSTMILEKLVKIADGLVTKVGKRND